MEIITNIDELNAIGRCKEVDLQKGLKEAQQTIAYMYEHGIGVVQNSASANYWYNQANK